MIMNSADTENVHAAPMQLQASVGGGSVNGGGHQDDGCDNDEDITISLPSEVWASVMECKN